MYVYQFIFIHIYIFARACSTTARLSPHYPTYQSYALLRLGPPKRTRRRWRSWEGKEEEAEDEEQEEEEEERDEEKGEIGRGRKRRSIGPCSCHMLFSWHAINGSSKCHQNVDALNCNRKLLQ